MKLTLKLQGRTCKETWGVIPIILCIKTNEPDYVNCMVLGYTFVRPASFKAHTLLKKEKKVPVLYK